MSEDNDALRDDVLRSDVLKGTGFSPSVELQPGDFYMEGPYLVFTAAYHLRRGTCCNSNCRHCPYK